jgi:short-subunit dehydrogenase
MSVRLKPLVHQVMVIVGASSEIGLATAQAAAKKKVKLVLAARSAEGLDEVVEKINADGGEAIAVPTDVTRIEDLENLARQAIDRFGRIDTWVNEPGWGMVNCSLVALPLLKQSGGALINVGGPASDAVVPLQGRYAASQYAVKGFTDALRVELEQTDKANVAITVVQPAAVPDPMIEPRKVADAILDAACNHRRYVRVGMGAKLNTFLAKFLTTLSDQLATKQARR